MLHVRLRGCLCRSKKKPLKTLHPRLEDSRANFIANLADEMPARIRIEQNAIGVNRLSYAQKVIHARVEPSQLVQPTRVRFGPVRSSSIASHDAFKLAEQRAVARVSGKGSELDQTNVARPSTLRVREVDVICIGEADLDGEMDSFARFKNLFLSEPVAKRANGRSCVTEGDCPFVGVLREETVDVEDTMRRIDEDGIRI